MFNQRKRVALDTDKNKHNILSRWRLIWYFVIVFMLTIYILFNWGLAIDFTPFDNFDRNNLLFVVWIIIVSLPFIRIESEKGKTGLDTGSDYWENKANEAKAKNIKLPDSKEADINEIDTKIGNAERGAKK
ncbi:MAG: hypothetical protein FWE29_03485 [Defluviitaleaceae bacterium]|nr:hypothetical protein [Defluviitaleaceae bacterium]